MTARRSADLDQTREWAVTAARAADDKKAIDPVVLEVNAILAITDFFVIASAPNDRLVETIVEEVEAKVKEDGGPSPLRIEGLSDRQWVLMDYGDMVVHVFLDEVRRFYDLERLWADAPRVEWTNGSARSAASGE
ncbi:MAG: ribosome silencing factor [Acidimicrobiia bacterium]